MYHFHYSLSWAGYHYLLLSAEAGKSVLNCVCSLSNLRNPPVIVLTEVK